MNHTHLSGNLTADIETRNLNDKVLNKFVLGSNHGDRALFLPVEVWNREHLRDHIGKGSRVIVSGYLKQENWLNKAGERRSRIVLVGNQVEFLDRNPRSNADGGEAEVRREVAAPVAG